MKLTREKAFYAVGITCAAVLIISGIFSGVIAESHYYQETVISKHFDEGRWYLDTGNFSVRVTEAVYLDIEPGTRIAILQESHPVAMNRWGEPLYYGKV